MRLYTLEELSKVCDLDGQPLELLEHPLPKGAVVSLSLVDRDGISVSTASLFFGSEEVPLETPLNVLYREEVFFLIQSFDPAEKKYTLKALTLLELPAVSSTAPTSSSKTANPDGVSAWHWTAQKSGRVTFKMTEELRRARLEDAVESQCEKEGVRLRTRWWMKQLAQQKATEEEYMEAYRQYKARRQGIKTAVANSDQVPAVGDMLTETISVSRGGQTVRSAFLPQGAEITCKPKNIHFLHLAILRDRILASSLEASKPFNFEVLDQTHVTDWSGRILPPKCREALRTGHVFRACIQVSKRGETNPEKASMGGGAYYFTIVRCGEELGGSMLCKVHDTYVLDLSEQPVAGGDGFLVIPRSAVSEVPLTWPENENLKSEWEKHATNWGFAVTGFREY
uniref:Uncharacterized protein n=1 Tax=Chromera velia CCMP2878 TaxID=1169474 RepID=A0A0G4IBF5_9ALVE|eukprot:Cvel_12739.t1-p1 / transcript=Cvel_12739.t1 / gene=Cvel_12739 / organism=Chromera_velia_CCMP2878 / gene_product=hypothetical protein / transcript_product=hypothetical protein / location=Cvel_scaffold846:52472-53659(+) / protein_length=396 / sequence_SO=supercontig / SO=protein_coding / is_pseudo=false